MAGTRARRGLAVLALIAVAAGIGVWWFVLRDTADPEASLDAVDAPAPEGAPARSTPDGQWVVRTGEDVFVGYRAKELFAGETVTKTATGRTAEVTGELTVAGGQVTTAQVTADLSALESDQERRDAALRTRGLETEQFPEATFVLDEPIALGDPAEGKEVTASASGTLTLHGTAKPVDIDLQARWDGATITVAGSAPIVFADHDIDVIEIPGFVTTEDNGTLELQLVFQPA